MSSEVRSRWLVAAALLAGIAAVWCGVLTRPAAGQVAGSYDEVRPAAAQAPGQVLAARRSVRVVFKRFRPGRVTRPAAATGARGVPRQASRAPASALRSPWFDALATLDAPMVPTPVRTVVVAALEPERAAPVIAALSSDPSRTALDDGSRAPLRDRPLGQAIIVVGFFGAIAALAAAQEFFNRGDRDA